MIDDVTTAAVGQAIAAQPDFIAELLAKFGIPPPTGAATGQMGLGALMSGGAGEGDMSSIPSTNGVVGGEAAPMGGGIPPPQVPVAPQAAAPTGGGAQGGLGALLAAAGRTGFQSADVKPVFSGGITQAQRAPEMPGVRPGASSVTAAALTNLLHPPSATPAVPSLGRLLRGG